MPDLPVRSAVPWGRVAIAWLAVSALLLVIGWQRLAEWRFPDPDDTLRIVQVRDLLAGQAWFDLHQYRINPGGSAVMHWSRIVDVPLAVSIMLLSPVLGQTLAEQVTVLLVPLLTLGAIMATIAKMAYRLFDKEVAIFACLACGLSPMLLLQVQPLRIDHHGWQICALIVAVAAVMNRRHRSGAIVAGMAMATGLLISIELLPLAATIAGVLLLRGLRDHELRWGLPAYLVSLAVGLLVLFALTRGFADLNQYCDAISPAHLLFFGIAGLASVATAWPRRPGALAALGLLACAGAAALAAFAWRAPACLSGPFGTLDPLVKRYWHANVLEGLPFWVQPLDGTLPIIAQALAALGICIYLVVSNTAERRSLWLDHALIMGAAIIGGLLVWRSMAFVGALSALPNGWLIHHIVVRFRSEERPYVRLAVVVGGICALVPSSPIELAKFAISRHDPASANSLSLSSCDLRESVTLLNDLQPATIFAPIDIGPSILERTPHSVVATGHHRSQLAMKDVILAFTSTDDEAHAIIARHRAGFVSICTDLIEPRIYADDAPEGLMKHLLEGKPPAWLKEVPLKAPPTFKVWRVAE